MTALTDREIEAARFRAYRYFSRIFGRPSPEAFESIRRESSVVAEIARTISNAVAARDAGAASSLERAASCLHSRIGASSIEGLAAEHARAFGAVIGTDCPPYETQYGSALVFQQTQRLADVAGFYCAFGLALADAERVDHLAVELEFMAFLAARALRAIDDDRSDPGGSNADCAVTVARAGASFLREHLLPWVLHFADRLVARAGPGVLGAAGAALSAFLDADARSRGIAPETIERFEVAPTSGEPEGSCFSCGHSGGPSAEANLRDVPS